MKYRFCGSTPSHHAQTVNSKEYISESLWPSIHLANTCNNDFPHTQTQYRLPNEGMTIVLDQAYSLFNSTQLKVRESLSFICGATHFQRTTIKAIMLTKVHATILLHCCISHIQSCKGAQPHSIYITQTFRHCFNNYYYN